ncbi:MAG: sorbosone dehydrogenase family protein, partial [Candidatus Obscuribacterales bacterium]|nr:sorbosone dehydrogenase family protein [Steroidobacteraceae bacterium]
GNNPDPRLKDARPDLAGKVTVPDVLFQAHSAALGIEFYTATKGSAVFPKEYQGDAFVTFHGSWNRGKRTGYKVVRMKMQKGVATGEYEDFLTGFVIDDAKVWGRPVGVAVARDGALLVTDDGSNTLWRVAHKSAK